MKRCEFGFWTSIVQALFRFCDSKWTTRHKVSVLQRQKALMKNIKRYADSWTVGPLDFCGVGRVFRVNSLSRRFVIFLQFVLFYFIERYSRLIAYTLRDPWHNARTLFMLHRQQKSKKLRLKRSIVPKTVRNEWRAVQGAVPHSRKTLSRADRHGLKEAKRIIERMERSRTRYSNVGVCFVSS